MRRAKAYSMSMLICNRFHERLTDIEKIATFTGVPFLEPRKSRLGPLKSTFNAENFVHSLSMSI